jgi:indole-3-glycerol phosphate synthase
MTSGSAFLDRITSDKRDAMSSISHESRRATRAAALDAIKARPAKHAFLQALQREDRTNIIAEVKRSSPSAGAIHQGADAVNTALAYERAGAAAISVLTEPRHFKGSLQDLIDVAAQVSVPLLRKDFTVDRHQIYEAAAAGASAVLLIVAALSTSELSELRMLAEDELSLDALIEAHSEPEVEAALNCGATVIGVNNRNLQTLEVDLETSRRLAHYILTDKVFISESGIKTPADIVSLKSVGYRAFLVGETLMRAANPSAALQTLAIGAAE